MTLKSPRYTPVPRIVCPNCGKSFLSGWYEKTHKSTCKAVKFDTCLWDEAFKEYTELHSQFVELLATYHNEHITFVSEMKHRRLTPVMRVLRSMIPLIQEMKHNNKKLREQMLKESSRRYNLKKERRQHLKELQNGKQHSRTDADKV